MFRNPEKCPSIKELEDYFLQKFDGGKEKEIVDHLYTCNICIDEARRVLNAIQGLQIIKADPLLGAAYDKTYDTVREYKCADDRKKRIIELDTKYKKYKVTLRPIEESDNMSLLEIQVLDDSIQGNLRIFINGQMEKAAIDKDGLVYIVVRSDIDLSKLVIGNEDF